MRRFKTRGDGTSDAGRGVATTGHTLSVNFLRHLLEMRQVVEEGVNSSHVAIADVCGRKGGRREERRGRLGEK